ncbi:hypothetical protein GCM10011583_11630 [Streptomyces camponoticapitis]|uniref:C2H2-type domain-containing protein n=1 Tax=Streptomyces camponoticapitis TaxID=1616125 RepID=A0ABQ2E049_9ACTN|nr:DUF6011 domain-containing protein [Streptomyces camponoticapitis]GGJ81849.1 hypothetical protein GCM10011583_11630 [Streptomyces camponoticapitis]
MTHTVLPSVVDPTVPVVCDDCDRPLTDPASRAAGRGPVCAAKYHRPRGRREASPDQLTIPEAHMPEPTNPAAAVEVRDRCPHCGDHQLVPRRLMAEHLARLHPDQPAPRGHCGNDPRTVLSPGDQAAIDEFKDYLAERKRTGTTSPAEPETDEEREQREDQEETERAHAAGDHRFCGPTCEVEFTSEALRNTILARAVPGSAGMLDELLRRARVAATPSTAAELPTPHEALHKLRYMLDRGKGRGIFAEYWRDVLDRLTDGPVEPCDSAEQHDRAQRAEAAIERTVDQMRAYVAAGSTGVNPRQVINLLSPTWPDGNFEAPAETEESPADNRRYYAVEAGLGWCRHCPHSTQEPTPVPCTCSMGARCSNCPDDIKEPTS